jgi:hypothetical protein
VIAWLLRAASSAIPDLVEPVPEGVAVRAARWLPVIAGKLSGMRAPAAAVTLGRTIVVHPGVQLTDRLLRHELAHVRQWQRHPISFPARYVINHFRHGYEANPYEIEARAAESSGGRQ